MSSKVSIILLTYNQVDYIEEAINSVFSQTYNNWELIISDNGSEDGTKELLSEYKDDKRIQLLFYDSNEYVTKRTNQALQKASGEFISFLYGDDYYLPNKIEDQIDCFKSLSKKWGMVHGPWFSYDQFTSKRTLETSLKVHGEALKEILENHVVKGDLNPISPLIRKECFAKYSFYEDLFTEGESIFKRIALSYKFFYLDKPLVVMRVHDKNARWFSKRNIEIVDACLERLIQQEDFPEDCIKVLAKSRSHNYSNGAWENIRLSKAIDKKYIRNRIYKAFQQDTVQALSVKNLISLVLTVLPGFITRFFNFLLDLVLNKKRSIYFDESFVKKNEE